MAVNKRLLQGAAAAPGGITPSEHFGVVLYEGDGSSSHSINGGKFGAGGYFNGTSSEVEISSDVLNINTISISAWININTTSGYRQIVSNYATGNYGWGFRVDDGGTLAYNTETVNVVSGSTVLSTNTWYHAVVTIDSAGNSSKIYLNGIEDGSGTYTAPSYSGNTNFHIGSLGNINVQYFSGKIDQVRIFTKALSSSEVSTLYAETASTVESLDPLSEDTTDTLQVLGDSSCIATYRFENNEDDESGNYDGTGTEIQYAAGRYGQAASFGSNSKVQLPSGSPFNDSDTIKSISAWVKADTTSSRVYPFSIGSSTIEDDFFNFGWIPANNYILLFIRDGSSSNQASHSAPLTADTEWHHIVVQTTGSAVQIFIDGESKSVTSSYSGTGSSSSWISYPSYGGSVIGNIGVNAALNPVYSNGKIDQVRFFNKALSAAEVTTLYNENSLVASYRFEGNANDDTRNYDGTASNVTYEYGLGFQPDLIWAKDRVATGEWHMLSDSTRGTNSQLFSNVTNAPDTKSTVIQSFDTGGFTVGSDNLVNNNGNDYVAWCLKANGGTTSSNTDGSITSTVQVNDAAGFSIVKYTGNNTANATIGHGLSATPQLIISKNLSNGSAYWATYHHSIGITRKFYLNDTSTGDTVSGGWLDVSSTLITLKQINANNINENGSDFINYCFAEVEGFSKFGSYTGNGSTDGPIVETNFEPAYVMIKGSSIGSNWNIHDNKRGGQFNDAYLFANTGNAEVVNSAGRITFLSNGFQISTSDVSRNSNGDTYIYMAFAADPDTEAPTVAKSFDIQAYDMAAGSDYDLSFAFKPQFVVTKTRDEGAHWSWGDIIRGNNSNLSSNDTNPVNTTNQWRVKDWYAGATSVTIAQHATVSTSNISYAWKADDNEPTINTEGSIDSIVSANANAGFSIVKYEGTGSNTTIGHSLSAAPEMMIIKNLDQTDNWVVYHSAVGTGQFLSLNSTDAASGSGDIFGTPNDTGVAPTSTVFTVGSNHKSGANGENYIAYCFHSVSGYSKFGSYTGTSSSGNSVNVGFAPDWVLIKGASSGSAWILHDTVRSDGTAHLRPNTSGAEDTGSNEQINFTSTGFSIRNSGATQINTSGDTYIYMAFKIN